MTHFRPLKATVCLTALFSASTAIADVTAEQVWEDWQENLAIYGEDGVSIGAVDVSGGTVTVNDLMLSMDDGTTSVEAKLGTITFEEQGDGTVAVMMQDSYPMTIVPESDVVINIEVSQTGMNMIVSGSENDMRYDITADRYAFTVLELIENGEPAFEGDMLIAANNLVGAYNIRTSEMRDIDYDIAVGSLDLLVDIKEPGGEGTATVSGKMDAMQLVSQLKLPLDTDVEDPAELFVRGMAVSGGYRFDSGNFIFDINADGESASGSISMGAGAINLALDQKTMSYDTSVSAVTAEIASADLPFPIVVGLAEYGTTFAMPIGATEDPADFALGFNLTDLTVNDEIWDMGDQAKVLPRDPLTLRMDLAGKAKLFFDLTDPEQADALEQADIPGEIYALNLNDLLVSGAGAMITGTGAFTFDNTDLNTFDGMPRPLGDATVTITGANGLIDNLVSMGLLPDDQASMGRMMMGMFARSTGDDQLETTVEVNAEGHLIVNGQRMQ